MSLQDIEMTKVKTSGGIARTIERSAEKLILDTLQISQYVYPIESTVRELASNAVDSQKEKEVAISILTGKTKPEDHFVEREGEKYKDSKWNPDYYNLESLNTEKNRVELRYLQNEGVGFADRFIVTDHGVGLGDKRLEGYFKLGYSTKRGTKEMLGAFGFGNKVALATRCDFYTMETVHNGRKFIFNCGSHEIQSMVGSIDMETASANDYILFNEGTDEEVKIYYQKTDEKNYTKITVPVKRTNRQKFVDAVHNQLLYFPNIDFVVKHENGHEEFHNIRANVLYSSKNLLVSDNKRYNKPHVVIVKDSSAESTVGVCYGHIDFHELEMETLFGSVGFKCPIRSVIVDEETGQETVIQEGVNVTPSRETVIWDEYTKQYVTNLIESAQEEASDLLSKELSETDYMSWLVKAEALTQSRLSGDNVISRLANIVDKEKIKPFYKPPKDVAGEYDLKGKIPFYPASSVFNAIDIRRLTGKRVYEKGQYVDKVERTIPNFFDLDTHHAPLIVVMQEEDNVKPRLERYIVEELGPSRTVLRVNLGGFSRETIKKTLEKNYSEVEAKRRLPRYEFFASYFLDNYEEYYGLKNILHYSEIEIDPEWEKKQDVKEQKGEAEKTMSDAERRELNNLTLVHYMNPINYSSGRFSDFTLADGTVASKEVLFTRTGHDVKPIALTDCNHRIYYGSTEDFEMLHTAAAIVYSMRPPNGYDPKTPYYFDQVMRSFENHIEPDTPRLLFVNKKVAKFLDKAGHKHISEFFETMGPDNEITCDPVLKKYMTYHLNKVAYNRLLFLNCFDVIHPEANKLYAELTNYMESCKENNMAYRKLEDHIKPMEVMKFIRNVATLQKEIAAGLTSAEIPERSRELTLFDDIGPMDVIDFDICQKFSILEEYSEGLTWMNHLTGTDNPGQHLSPDVEEAITNYLHLKDKFNFNFSTQ